ncbi:MAG: ABC transporter permease [Halothermotrichaceae bacterium]
MFAYIMRRCLYIIPTLILISIIAFAVIQAPPGDFLTSQIEQLRQQYGSAADRQIEAMRKRYGLGQPMYTQYFKWVTGILTRFDFGQSFAQNRSVKEIIIRRLPFTVLMTFCTLIFTWAVAIPIGVYSAVKQYTVFDYIFTFLAFIGRSIPNFLLALVLMYIFYANFGWSLGGLFSQDYQGAAWGVGKVLDLARHLILPIIVIGTAGTAGMVRILRGMMLDELNKEYVQTARSKGLSEKVVIWKHVFRIAVLPIISTIGWLLPRLVSGAMITSIVLNLPTTGAAMYSALSDQDMYVAGSFVLLLSTLTIIGTLISDILLAQIDPRIRYD